MVLGALGGDPGGIWVPRRPKAQKAAKKLTRGPSRELRAEEKVIWMCSVLFSSSFSRDSLFSSIVDEFRLQISLLLGGVNMAEV